MSTGNGSLTRRSFAVGFLACELAFLAAMHLFGGPPWVGLGVLACVVQVLADFRVRPLVGLLPAVFWAAAHAGLGDRQLFFPYAMAISAHVAGQFIDRGRLASAASGGLIVAAFIAIRMMQAATTRVLAVELAVAAVILAVTVGVLPVASGRRAAGIAVTALASLAAYAGLAL